MIQSKGAYKLSIAIVLAGILGFFAYHGYIFISALFNGGKPPEWSYGEGKFARLKRVADRRECAELIRLLEAEKVEEFNRARKAHPFADRYLELKELRLTGKDLAGVDLSRCILTSSDFSGSNLRGASFRKSYVAQTTFLGAFWLQNGDVTEKMARTTDLTGSHFDGATLRATLYHTGDFGYFPMTHEPGDIGLCPVKGATGLGGVGSAARTHWDVPVTVTQQGPKFTFSKRQGADFDGVSVPWDNPFQDVPETALKEWAGMKVDLERLRKMPARRLKSLLLPRFTRIVTGSDPNVIMVITDLPSGITDIVSAGPLVLMNGTRGAHHVVSESTLWIRDDASHRGIAVAQTIVFSSADRDFGRAMLSPAHHWSDNSPGRKDWTNRLVERKPIEEVAEIMRLRSPDFVKPTVHGSDIEPLIDPTRMRALLQRHPELAGAEVAIARGTHFGSGAIDMVQTDPKVILLLQGFATHGSVLAAGPVVLIRSAVAGGIFSKSWIETP